MKPKISDADLCRAAKRVGCTTAEIKTFLEVETKNAGFDDHDRPLILFERHWFHHYTRGKYDASHPGISSSKAGGYGAGGNHQWDRFAEAAVLNEWAAKMSTSYGLGQVMGFNFKIAGFDTLDAFEAAMFESEGRQLDASVEFILHNRLDDELRRHDWVGFARGYNGAGFRKNDYDAKLAAAFRKHSRNSINCDLVANRSTDVSHSSGVSFFDQSVDTGAVPTNITPLKIGDVRNTTGAQSNATPTDNITTVETKTGAEVDTPTGTVVTGGPTKVTTPADTPPVPGGGPDDPAKQVSNPLAARVWAIVGAAGASVTSIWAALTSHAGLVVVGCICATAVILAIIFRSVLLDWLRMKLHADKTKINVT